MVIGTKEYVSEVIRRGSRKKRTDIRNLFEKHKKTIDYRSLHSFVVHGLMFKRVQFKEKIENVNFNCISKAFLSFANAIFD